MNLLLYGLQRSGTNYLEQLLLRNFETNFLNSDEDRSSPLQKHCRLYREKGIIPAPQYENRIIVETFEQFETLFSTTPDYYLVISKDPYSWHLSYEAWAEKCNWPKVMHHYIEEYNLFYETLIDMSRQSDKFVFVRFVDLIRDEGAVLENLTDQLGLKKKLLSRFRLSIPKKVSQSADFSESNRAYYLNEAYLKEYGEEDLQRLNDRLDTQVISTLGYELRGSNS